MTKYVFLILLATTSTTVAQDDRLYPPLQLPIHVSLPPRHQRQLCEWCKPFYPGYPLEAVLHALIHRGDITYVVFSTIGSRGEQHIQWVAISNGDVVDYQRHTIDSLWRPTSGAIDGWCHGVLSWHAEGGFTRRDDIVESYYAAFFDPKTPEKGFQIKKAYNL